MIVRELPHILKTTLLHKFEDFVPFVVLEGMNFVVLGVDKVGNI